MTQRRPWTRVLDFCRAGYPSDGLPANRSVPLLALLDRRVSDAEVGLVAQQWCQAGPPILPTDIESSIATFLGSAPGSEDTARVGAYLRSTGRLVADVRAGLLPCGPEDVFAEVCKAAVTSIPGADLADVMLLRDDRVFSVGATSPLAATLDEVQRQLGEGPCMQAVGGAAMVCADDFRAETRWPRWCSEAARLGVRSALSYRLYSRGHVAATMNIVGRRPVAWDETAQAAGAALAARAVAAIGASSWGAALVNRAGQPARNDQV